MVTSYDHQSVCLTCLGAALLWADYTELTILSTWTPSSVLANTRASGTWEQHRGFSSHPSCFLHKSPLKKKNSKGYIINEVRGSVEFWEPIIKSRRHFPVHNCGIQMRQAGRALRFCAQFTVLTLISIDLSTALSNSCPKSSIEASSSLVLVTHLICITLLNLLANERFYIHHYKFEDFKSTPLIFPSALWQRQI